jgi:hypothetical protein
MIITHDDKLHELELINGLMEEHFLSDVLSWMLKNLRKLDQQTSSYIDFIHNNMTANRTLALDIQTLVMLDEDDYLGFSLSCGSA